ncbi:hypothetical protein Q0F99_17055 [Rathayibacter oskolensis]|uniref:shikimate dehydrogenase family protein n=1 Tax=Rathayibacter oskolensis TaxID=1891671 RepID=UPI00265E68A1|nr:hypothetical protein [Rathayibacter oskolensis]WKK71209.1 hypothetical protein Q0F99_17055 [Rathayibacter oskolensis]
MTTRLAVLGSPIAHSKSPALHAAAYGVLGLEWSYTAVEATEATLAEVIGSERWRGLSLTMPLKHAVRPLLAEEDLVARATGAVNTVLVEGERLRGFNTDVAGIVRALAEAGVTSAERVDVLGGGATAASAIAAAAELGASRVTATLRSPEKAAALEPVATALGVALDVRSFAEWGRGEPHPLVVSTLPGERPTRSRCPTRSPAPRRSSMWRTRRGPAHWRCAGVRPAHRWCRGSACCCTRRSCRCGSSSGRPGRAASAGGRGARGDAHSGPGRSRP